MSKTQHADATLDSYQGPFFPDGVDELRQLIDEHGVEGTIMVMAAEMVGSHSCAEIATKTSDDYAWYRMLGFVPDHDDIVVILIPWAQDWDASDGTQADRSIALYSVTGDQATIEAVLREYIASLANVVGQDGADADTQPLHDVRPPDAAVPRPQPGLGS